VKVSAAKASPMHASRGEQRVAASQPSARGSAAALAPPPYGIDFVDRGMQPGPVVQRYLYINTDPPAEKDSLIYGIWPTPINHGDEPIYVGQTSLDRAGSRFVEHARDDAGAPWHKDVCDYSSDDADDWPYLPRTLENLKDVTRFEVTAAEQWWYEDKGGKQALYNRSGGDANQPMKRATFYNYKGIGGNYDHNKIGVSSSWKPTDS
jgi:hypothetical protein